MADETEDSAKARTYATQNAQRIASGCRHMLGCGCDPPHHLRCDWMREGERCRLGSGHTGPHAYKPRVTPPGS